MSILLVLFRKHFAHCGIRVRMATLVCLSLPCLLTGCGTGTPKFTEFKRIDEALSESEVRTFLRIVAALPEQRVPAIPSVFDTATPWDQTRTQPISKLVNERVNSLDERWSVQWLTKRLDADRHLDDVLRRENLTREQFVGLTLAIAVATSRSQLRDSQDLNAIIAQGENVLERLRRDGRLFSSLTEVGGHYVLQQAIWISRVDRAKHLRVVPGGNIDLVQKYFGELSTVLPPEFLANPLDSVADRLAETGVPFVELSETGSDVDIQWSADEAIHGSDSPDPEFSVRSDDEKATFLATRNR